MLEVKPKPKCSDKFDDAREIGSGMICIVAGRPDHKDLKELNIPISSSSLYNPEHQEYKNAVRYGFFYIEKDRYYSICYDCGFQDIGSIIDHMIMRARNGEYAHYKDYAPDGTMHSNYRDMAHRPKPDAAAQKPNDPTGEKGLFKAISASEANAPKTNQVVRLGGGIII